MNVVNTAANLKRMMFHIVFFSGEHLCSIQLILIARKKNRSYVAMWLIVRVFGGFYLLELSTHKSGQSDINYRLVISDEDMSSTFHPGSQATSLLVITHCYKKS